MNWSVIIPTSYRLVIPLVKPEPLEIRTVFDISCFLYMLQSMIRPPRIEFAGAQYHITSRGNRCDDIYVDRADRGQFQAIVAESCERYHWTIHAYYLMDNHYHLLVETPDANLSMGMRQLNGLYTQRFNHRHKRAGHLFQGRFKAIILQREPYLLELARHIVLNPVSARMVRRAKDWPWSSYRATAGQANCPTWLSPKWLLSAFGRRKSNIMKRYRTYVSEGKDWPSPWGALWTTLFAGLPDHSVRSGKRHDLTLSLLVNL